jgi:hypothetical protein
MAPLLCSHSTHVTGLFVLKVLFQEQRGFAYEAKQILICRMSQMSSFSANGFSVKPFLWLWYNRFFPTARFGYYDQTSADF